MSQLTLENNTNNALKVDLATKLAGEDITNNWIGVNIQGYKVVKGLSVNVTTTAASANTEVDAEAISIFNPGPTRIWARFDGTAAGAAAPSIPVAAGLTVSIPVKRAKGASQLSLIAETSTVNNVSVVAFGNS